MLNEVNKSVCAECYGAHPFMSFSVTFTIDMDAAEEIAAIADQLLLAGAKKPAEEILADALLRFGLEAVDNVLDGSGISNMSPFAATIADMVQALTLLGINHQDHKAVAYFSEFDEEPSSEDVLVTILFVPKDAESILLK